MFLQLFTWLRLAIHIGFLYLWFGKGPVFYSRALQLLRNNNILFTKIFQSLANSNPVRLNPDLRTQLQKYTANTSYTEDEINYETLDKIERTHGVQIDRHVINSGMIALVFKGTDSSGNPVIVKLRRNSIVEQLRIGCTSVATLYKWASRLKPKNIYIRILRPFIRNIGDIIEQCNFSKEIRNLRQAKEDFAPLDFIQIPTVYNTDDTDDTDYILMEYIDGVHTLPASTTEEERARYMEKYATFASYMFLFNAIQHTDLHNGNILFTPTGLGIIDYGMAIQPSDEIHEIILNICNIIRGNQQLHEIDFIDTFKELFDPPLVKSEMPPEIRRKVEDICISIAQPMIEVLDLDELNVTDNLDKLSVHLQREIVLNRYVYKIILGFSMMSAKSIIMGADYPTEKMLEIEKRGLRTAYGLIM